MLALPQTQLHGLGGQLISNGTTEASSEVIGPGRTSCGSGNVAACLLLEKTVLKRWDIGMRSRKDELENYLWNLSALWTVSAMPSSVTTPDATVSERCTAIRFRSMPCRFTMRPIYIAFVHPRTQSIEWTVKVSSSSRPLCISICPVMKCNLFVRRRRSGGRRERWESLALVGPDLAGPASAPHPALPS